MKINKQTIFRLVVVALLAVPAFYLGSILVKVVQHRAEDAAHEEKRSEYYQKYKKLCEKDLLDREKDGEVVASFDLSDCINERMVNYLHRIASELTKCLSRNEMTLNHKIVVDGGMSG